MVMVWATRKRPAHVGPWMSAVCLGAQGSSQSWWAELASTLSSPLLLHLLHATLGALEWIRAIIQTGHAYALLSTSSILYPFYATLAFIGHVAQVCSSHYDFRTTLKQGKIHKRPFLWGRG